MEATNGLRPQDHNGHVPAEPAPRANEFARAAVEDSVHLAYETGRLQGQIDVMTGQLARDVQRLGELTAELTRRLDDREQADRRAIADSITELRETVMKLAGAA